MEEAEAAFAVHDSTSIDADQATDVEEKPTELDDVAWVHEVAADIVAPELCLSV